jgi:hypothetical protein
MDDNRKEKIENKKKIDKKYRQSFVDDDNMLRKAQKKQFQQKKREIIEDDDSWKNWEYYD